MSDSLPLFVLGQPIFPSVSFNLQVFEQRYLRLVRESMRAETSFGVVSVDPSLTSGEPYPVGVRVQIVDWRQQKNGLLGITVFGSSRFIIDSFSEDDDGLFIGEVRDLEDALQEDPLDMDRLDGMKQLLEELAKHPFIGWSELPDNITVSDLLWRLTQVLPVTLEDKLDLIADSSIHSRMSKIENLLEKLRSI